MKSSPPPIRSSTLCRSVFAAGLLIAAATSCVAEASLWDAKCASCHGPDGKGKTKMGLRLSINDLTEPAIQDSFTDEDAFRAIREGIRSESGKTRMKAIEGLEDEQVQALVAYVRQLRS